MCTWKLVVNSENKLTNLLFGSGAIFISRFLLQWKAENVIFFLINNSFAEDCQQMRTEDMFQQISVSTNVQRGSLMRPMSCWAKRSRKCKSGLKLWNREWQVDQGYSRAGRRARRAGTNLPHFYIFARSRLVQRGNDNEELPLGEIFKPICEEKKLHPSSLMVFLKHPKKINIISLIRCWIRVKYGCVLSLGVYSRG